MAVDEARAFLQAILEDPDDLSARLIFADWLEDTGDEANRARADLIRVQCALEDLPEDDPRRLQFQERQRDLLLSYGAAWAAPVGVVNGVQRWTFRRGFVEGVALRTSDLPADLERLAAVVPLRELQILGLDSSSARMTSERHARAAARSPQLQRLRGLDVGGYWEPTVPGELLTSPHLTNLRTLRLHRQVAAALPDAPCLAGLTTLQLGGFYQAPSPLLRSARLGNLMRLELGDFEVPVADLEDLAGSPHLGRLEVLALNRLRLSLPHVDALAGARLSALRQLELSGNRLDARDVRLLAGSSLLAAVEFLDLSCNAVGAAGGATLLDGTALPRLKRLNLASNRLGPQGARDLACLNLPRLAALNLGTNKLGDEGAAALAEWLPDLTSLALPYNNLSADGLRRLAGAWPGRPAMLNLSWNPLGDEGVRALAESPLAERLEALDLGYAELGDGAARALADSPRLARLATLNLGTNRIGCEGLRALAGSPHLSSLRSLNLGYNRLKAGDSDVLVESPLLGRLEALHLMGNDIPGDEVRVLRRAFRGILG
jgi:uncharacterized protein (TIGR02996 family)